MKPAGPGREPRDPYRVLGVSPGAPQRDIARANRWGVQHAHPDARPHDPPAAAARCAALTAAYDLLRDPGRRADYHRGHPAAEPTGRPPRPGQPAWAPRWRGSAFLPGPAPGQPIWAGPVHIEPPAATPATSQHGREVTAAEVEDPVVIPGPPVGQVWGWPW